MEMSARVKSEYPNSRSSLCGFVACVLLPQDTDYFTVELACVVTCIKY